MRRASSLHRISFPLLPFSALVILTATFHLSQDFLHGDVSWIENVKEFGKADGRGTQSEDVRIALAQLLSATLQVLSTSTNSPVLVVHPATRKIKYLTSSWG